jgi:hypothetical protein
VRFNLIPANFGSYIYCHRIGGILTHSQIQYIYQCRDLGKKQRLGAAFARSYGVSAKAIRDIWNGVSYQGVNHNAGQSENSSYFKVCVELEPKQLPIAPSIPRLPTSVAAVCPYFPQTVSSTLRNEVSGPHNISPGIGIKWQLPLLARTSPRRFWGFDYSIKPIANMFDSAPSVSNAVEQVLMNSKNENIASSCFGAPLPFDIAPDALKSHHKPPKALTHYEDEEFFSKDLMYGAVNVDLSRPQKSVHTWESALSLDTVGLKASQSLSGNDSGFIIPLVEIDLLRIFVFDLLHANCSSISRFLRLWSGTGGCERGVLVEWCTNKTTAEKVRS